MATPSPVQPPDPVDVVDLFPVERRGLLRLLVGLTDDQWAMSTACPGWTVKDVALHVLGVDVGNLSAQRDGFRDVSAAGPVGNGWTELVDGVNRFNEPWVASARRISPRLLCELLAYTGEAVVAYFRSLDLHATGERVSWAGPDPAPMWLHVAREYTERWTHQQQIRDAVGLPGFTGPRYLMPVLATFIHALPRTLREVTAPPGTRVRLVIGGQAGGAWIALCTGDGWLLGQDDGNAADAIVTIDQDAAWRLFTKGMTPGEAMPRVRIEGDHSLGAAVLEMVSIIA